MSLIISPDLHRGFKSTCAREGKEMTEVLLEFIQQYVAEHPPDFRPAKKKGGQQ